MKLLRGMPQSMGFEQGVVASIGNFDGVHLGHQNLLKILKTKANELQLPLVLIVFEPQPREYFQQDQAPARISSLREKLDALAVGVFDARQQFGLLFYQVFIWSRSVVPAEI